jgi:hypothetical protein
LGALVSATEQDDDFLALLDEIESVARTVGNTRLADAFADRLHITKIANFHTANARNYSHSGVIVPEVR